MRAPVLTGTNFGLASPSRPGKAFLSVLTACLEPPRRNDAGGRDAMDSSQFGQISYCASPRRKVGGRLRDGFRRRTFKGAVVGAIDRKYRSNLRAEVQHLFTDF